MWMYEELASWWPPLSAPEEYAGEAALFRERELHARHRHRRA
jgi:hypothetical protein